MNSLHIISFNIPYPPDYGGVIDVFYKIKALSQAKIRINLHCFEYGRKPTDILKEYCHKVYYYKRGLGINHAISTLPYIVKTRQSEELLQNLLKNNEPILFEGLHTTAYLNHELLKNRIKIVRTHNVEHVYYTALAQSEKKLANKIFFKSESAKLKAYESVLNKATAVAAISKNDFNYFNKKYKNVFYIPAFHPYDNVSSKTGKGDYILFHGDLSTGENIISCLYLIKKIFSK
ncbi:MAG: glycosyltransferase family 1 protein, partial [Bacteroidia bacterium]|nr:glycosyltransferase family 1 protein [Bacteroidia bacterium]